MNDEQRKRLENDILNKRVVDYGNYRIIYNIVTGEFSIYENSLCVMKKRNVEEVTAFFKDKECIKKKLHNERKAVAKGNNYCRELNITCN